MNEREFFLRLEFILCEQLHTEAPGGWCDGFAPMDYFVTSRWTFVTGNLWLMGIPREMAQEPWRFRLRVGESLGEREHADWSNIKVAFRVDVDAHTVFVHGSRGTAPSQLNESDDRPDAIDYLAHNGINGEARDWARGTTIIAKRGTSEVNGITA